MVRAFLPKCPLAFGMPQGNSHGMPKSKKRKPNRDEAVRAYLRLCADFLGLLDWVVTFDPDKTPDATEDEDVFAEVHSVELQTAVIYFAHKFWSATPEFKRHVVVHELCHLHTALLHEITGTIQDVIPNPAGQILYEQLTLTEEHIVERFTRLLSDALPLPTF